MRYKPYPNNPAKAKYYSHRTNANRRKIPFLISFDEWYELWTQSGYWELRGSGKGKYHMCRYNDIGPYQIGNVFIQACEANCSQAHIGKPKSEEHKEKMRKPKQNKKGP